MSWRYMAARETHNGEEGWSVREVYDNEGWTDRDSAPYGSTREELLEVLRMMTQDVEHPWFLDLDKGCVDAGFITYEQ